MINPNYPYLYYTPPDPARIRFSFALPILTLHFDFLTTPYTPPSADNINFHFINPLLTLNFDFQPEGGWYDEDWLAREKLKNIVKWTNYQIRGSIAKTWTFRVHKGRQQFYPYVTYPDPKTPAQLAHRARYREASHIWHNLELETKNYWRLIGERKKEPLPGYCAFMQAYLLNLVNLDTMRHKRNLATS